jgi:hypothetical protein
MFVTEIARKYNYWLHFFHEKRKNQFIPLPWKVGDFIFRNMNKIDEFAGHFRGLNLRYVERVKGFDPSGIFVEHLLAIGFSNSFINAILNEDRDNDSGTPAHDTGDLETILNTNELYKQKGKGPGEKSAQSPTVTPKSTTSRSSAPTTHQIKKVTHSSSGRGGDQCLLCSHHHKIMILLRQEKISASTKLSSDFFTSGPCFLIISTRCSQISLYFS